MERFFRNPQHTLLTDVVFLPSIAYSDTTRLCHNASFMLVPKESEAYI